MTKPRSPSDSSKCCQLFLPPSQVYCFSPFQRTWWVVSRCKASKGCYVVLIVSAACYSICRLLQHRGLVICSASSAMRHLRCVMCYLSCALRLLSSSSKSRGTTQRASESHTQLNALFAAPYALIAVWVCTHRLTACRVRRMYVQKVSFCCGVVLWCVLLWCFSCGTPTRGAGQATTWLPDRHSRMTVDGTHSSMTVDIKGVLVARE